MIYVMSDIHGMYDKFCKMLKLINFNKDDYLYIIGDAIDRGPDSAKVLKLIMESDNIELIMGNHEVFMIDYFSRYNKLPNKYELNEQWQYEIWIQNGGKETIESLITERKNIPLYKILSYFKNIKTFVNLTIENSNFFLVHANINTYLGNIIDTDVDTMLWERRKPSDKDVLKGNTWLITGHTPTFHFNKKDFTIFNNHNWYCIDCFANGKGMLGCLRLDDFKEFYVK